MKTSPLRCLLIIFNLLAGLACAQTATWLAPGPNGTTFDWNDPANWDTGSVPNAATATAVFQAHPFLGSPTLPGTAPVTLDSTPVTVGEIRYNLAPGGTQTASPLHLGTTLRIEGTGITNTQTSPAVFIVPQIRLQSTGVLEFANGASAGHISLVPDAPTTNGFEVNFRDHSSAGFASITVGDGNITFLDASTAGSARFTLSGASTITFRDQASSGTATITPLSSTSRIVVRDQADISQLALTGAGALDISGAAGDVTMGGINGAIDINLGANRLTFSRFAHNTVSFLHGRITGTTGGLTFTSTTHSIAVVTNPDNDYTGQTLIASTSRVVLSQGGRLNHVRVTNNSQINVNSHATVGGYLDLAHGRLTLSDNATASTLTVQGDYAQGPESVLTLNSVYYPSLVVTGTATLGGRLAPGFLPSSALLGSSRYTLITAGNITGTFHSTGGTASTLARSVQLAYTNNEVALQVTQLPFAGFGVTPSQKATGANLDANVATATGPFRNLLLHLNSYTAPHLLAAALGEMSPDTYGTLVEEGFASAASAQGLFDARLASLRQKESANGFSIFAEGHNRRDRFDTIDGLWDNDYRSSGGAMGGMWRTGGFSGGIIVDRQKSSAALDPFGSHATLTATTPGLFVQHAPANFFVNASVARTKSRYTLLRHVTFPGVVENARANPTGTRTDFAVNTGYVVDLGRWQLVPSAGLLGSNWKMGDFAETGAAVTGLVFTGWSTDSLRSRVGLQAAYRTKGGRVQPRFNVLWLHELKKERGIPARLIGATTGYFSPGRPAETDLVQAGLSFDCRIGRAATMYVNLGGAWGRNSSVTSDLSAGFRWEF